MEEIEELIVYVVTVGLAWGLLSVLLQLLPLAIPPLRMRRGRRFGCATARREADRRSADGRPLHWSKES